MSRFLMHLTAVSVLFAVTACSGGRGTRPGSRPADAERTVLLVDNQSFDDLTVYVLNATQRIRLGRATAHQQSAMTIPHTLVGSSRDLQFLAEPITRRGGAISNTRWVQPGDTVRLLISP